MKISTRPFLCGQRTNYRIELQGSRSLQVAVYLKSSSTIWTDLHWLIFSAYVFSLPVCQARHGEKEHNFVKVKKMLQKSEKVVFKDVYGCDEAKEEVSKYRFLRISSSERWRHKPKGVLMVGPPVLANSAAAVAGSGGTFSFK